MEMDSIKSEMFPEIFSQGFIMFTLKFFWLGEKSRKRVDILTRLEPMLNFYPMPPTS